jgi:hypothetical protein
MAQYDYEIVPRAAGKGWRLKLLEDGQEVGGGSFPVDAQPLPGIDWWNGLAELERAHWLEVAGSAVAADAWSAFLLAEAHADARAQAEEWLDSRGEP